MARIIGRALLALPAVVPVPAGCARGGVWANVPDDPGPLAAACRRAAEHGPQFRLHREMRGGNTANAERVRQDLLVALPQIHHPATPA